MADNKAPTPRPTPTPAPVAVAPVPIRLLIEEHEGDYICTSFDVYGQVARASSVSRSVAVKKCEARTLNRLGYSQADVAFEVNYLNQGADQ